MQKQANNIVSCFYLQPFVDFILLMAAESLLFPLPQAGEGR